MNFKEVTKEISFADLFPRKANRAQNIMRWNEWKKTLTKEELPEFTEYWATNEDCLKCDMYSKKDDWCNFANLPPSVNPVLSFRHGICGLACCGAYKCDVDLFTVTKTEVSNVT